VKVVRVLVGYVCTKPAGKKQESDLEHERETLDEEVEGRFLESMIVLTVSATLDHRPSGPERRKYQFSHCFPNIAMNAANKGRLVWG
jgi:hypothetical protein